MQRILSPELTKKVEDLLTDMYGSSLERIRLDDTQQGLLSAEPLRQRRFFQKIYDLPLEGIYRLRATTEALKDQVNVLTDGQGNFRRWEPIIRVYWWIYAGNRTPNDQTVPIKIPLPQMGLTLGQIREVNKVLDRYYRPVSPPTRLDDEGPLDIYKNSFHKNHESYPLPQGCRLCVVGTLYPMFDPSISIFDRIMARALCGIPPTPDKAGKHGTITWWIYNPRKL